MMRQKLIRKNGFIWHFNTQGKKNSKFLSTFTAPVLNILFKDKTSQAWKHMLSMSALRRLRQAALCEFKANLSYRKSVRTARVT